MAKPKSELEWIAYRLILTRHALDMTNAEICTVTGIGTNTYSQWETAKNRPELGKAKVLCDTLGYTLDWIYRGRRDGLPAALAAKIAVLDREWQANGPPPQSRGRPSKR